MNAPLEYQSRSARLFIMLEGRADSRPGSKARLTWRASNGSARAILLLSAWGPGGIVTVSAEQLLAWNPEVVIIIESDFFTAARSDDVWKSVKAVRDGRLYVAPTEPFPWLDFPPSVNRLIGLKWLGRVLYPQQFPEGLREETRRFYGLFYHHAADERQLDALLGSSGRAGP